MLKTKIEWCDSTWNPVTGCRHECPYCYARHLTQRFGGFEPQYSASAAQDGNGNYELGENERKYKKTKDGKVIQAPYPFGFEPTLHRYRLNQPRKWVKPQTIFVCSMADLFGRWVPDGWIEAVFEACDKAPHHRYVFLTKNPRRYEELAKAGKLPQKENYWYGSTLDSMKSPRYSGRLLDNTFACIEPITERMDVGLGSFGGDRWVIIGAETGNRKGKITPEKEWIDTICNAAGINGMRVFMKDSLLPIVGEENMLRELPWAAQAGKE